MTSTSDCTTGWSTAAAWRAERWLIAGFLLAALPRSASARAASATRIPPGQAIAIDGRLNEPVWAAAPAEGDFRERRPSPGAAPPVASTARVLYDDDAIYFGLILGRGAEEALATARLSRDDPAFYLDDSIVIKLDVQHDRRTTLTFAVNPKNAQTDFIVLDNGKRDELGLDLLWQSETRIEADRWVAEVRIPITSLGVTGDPGEHVMGMQITHNHAARGAQYDWSHTPPEYGPFAATHYGELRAVAVTRTGRPVTMAPYARVRWSDRDAGDSPLLAGGDVVAQLGASTWGQLTALTDFAEADLDDPVVNLDRFPLFQPEKRQFFLRGLDVFDFGEPGTAQPFFSRRIGLDDAGDPLPMFGGFKAFHRTDRFSAGLFDAVTGDPMTNWAVTRLQLEPAPAVSLGAIATTRHAGGEPWALTGGLDGRLRAAGNRLEVAGSWAVSAGEDAPPSDSGMAAGSLAWIGRRLRPRLSALRVGDRFDPAAGFVRRAGILRAALELPLVTYTRRFGLEQVRVTAAADTTYSDEASTRLGRRGSATVDLVSPELSMQASGGAAEDVVEAPFELVTGVMIPAGTFGGPNLTAALARSGTRNPSGAVRYRWSGGYFGGRLDTVSASLEGSLWILRLVAAGEASRIDLPDHAPFWARVASATLRAAPSDELQADATLQVNQVDRSMVVQTRLRWRFAAASDLLLVYAHGDPALPASDHAHELTAKLRTLFDLLL